MRHLLQRGQPRTERTIGNADGDQHGYADVDERNLSSDHMERDVCSHQRRNKLPALLLRRRKHTFGYFYRGVRRARAGRVLAYRQLVEC